MKLELVSSKVEQSEESAKMKRNGKDKETIHNMK